MDSKQFAKLIKKHATDELTEEICAMAAHQFFLTGLVPNGTRFEDLDDEFCNAYLRTGGADELVLLGLRQGGIDKTLAVVEDIVEAIGNDE